MFTFNGYGTVHSVKMGEGTGLAVKTTGKYAKMIPLFFSERISRPQVGAKVFIIGEITLSRREFTLLKVTQWQTLDAEIRSAYTAKGSSGGDSSGGDGGF